MQYGLLTFCWLFILACSTSPTQNNPLITTTTELTMKEQGDLEKYGRAYNATRATLGLYPIPADQVELITPGKYATKDYLKWQTTQPRGKANAQWMSKEIYYNEKQELIEVDVFQGANQYTIFDMAKEDIYVDNCPTMDCDPPTVLENEKLRTQYNHSTQTWQIALTTANPAVAPNYYAERELISNITIEKMQQLLEEWGIVS